eukprot:3408354-Pleurochrysis_carterae.AAC.3
MPAIRDDITNACKRTLYFTKQEGSRLWHGRPEPFDGEEYAGIFIGYLPRQTGATLQSLRDAAYIVLFVEVAQNDESR